MEQLIRAARADELGLVRMLPEDGRRDGREMAAALRQLPRQNRPSEVMIPGLLDGQINLGRLVDRWLLHRRQPALRLARRKVAVSS